MGDCVDTAGAGFLATLRSEDGSLDAGRCARLMAGGVSVAAELVADSIDAAPTSVEVFAVIDQITAEVGFVSGAQAVAALLAAAGIEKVFAYPGTSELSICDAVNELPGIDMINGRGDKECAFMAAGASLLKPCRGAAILHAARGLTNATGGLADARRNEAGSVYVVGLPSTGSARFLPPHGEPQLLESIGAFAKWAWEASAIPEDSDARECSALEFVTNVRHAVDVARRRPWGPTLIGLPQDVAEARWIPLTALAKDPVRIATPNVDVERAVVALSSASRPVILVDDCALRSDGFRPALKCLSGHIGAPVFQVRYRRGPMLFERLREEEVSNFIGWLNQYSYAHQQILEKADLLITVEDRNMYRRVVGELPRCRKIAINSVPEKVFKNEYFGDTDVLVVGDPASMLSALADKLGVMDSEAWFSPESRAENRVTPEPPSDDVDEARRLIVSAIAATIGKWDAPVIVDDSQMFGGLISEHYDELPGELRVFGGHGGFVGGGLSYATGLAIADPTVRVMCTLGDQAFTNSFQGLVAAVQENARVVIVVCNNGHSVSLDKQAAASFGGPSRPYLANVGAIDYRAIAEAIGLYAERVNVPIGGPKEETEPAIARFHHALERAASVDGPSLVELELPGCREAWRGIWLTQGFEQASLAMLP
jgi:acetolactate synthase I/II/III large subunit